MRLKERKRKVFFFWEAITFYINLMKNARSTIAKFIAYKPYKLISQLVNMCVLYINVGSQIVAQTQIEKDMGPISSVQ